MGSVQTKCSCVQYASEGQGQERQTYDARYFAECRIPAAARIPEGSFALSPRRGRRLPGHDRGRDSARPWKPLGVLGLGTDQPSPLVEAGSGTNPSTRAGLPLAWFPSDHQPKRLSLTDWRKSSPFISTPTHISARRERMRSPMRSPRVCSRAARSTSESPPPAAGRSG